MAAMHGIETSGVKQTCVTQRAAEKVGPHEVDLLTVKQEIDPAKDPMGIISRMIKTMYGPEGMISRLTTLPGLVVQSVGGGKGQMEELMHSLESSAGASSQPAGRRPRRIAGQKQRGGPGRSPPAWGPKFCACWRT